jgi:hypothetical protein
MQPTGLQGICNPGLLLKTTDWPMGDDHYTVRHWPQSQQDYGGYSAYLIVAQRQKCTKRQEKKGENGIQSV